MSYESHFPKESIDNIKRIADVQEKLLEINNVDTVELKKEILIGIEQGYLSVSTLIHLFLVASEYRVLLTPMLCDFLNSLLNEKQELLPEVQKNLLNIFTKPFIIHCNHCFFARQCMDRKIINEKQVVEMLRYIYMIRPTNPERLFTAFCWFAPEIQKLDLDLYEIIVGTMEMNLRSGYLNEIFINFYNILKILSDNDWAVYRQCVMYGFNPNKYVILLARDNVEFLEKDKEFNPNFLVPACIFDCTHLFMDCKPTLLHVAAFFGAEKCFDYLLKVGANPNTKTSKYGTIAQYAFAGGNSNIIAKILQMKIDFDGVYETCAKFHRNNLFNYLLENNFLCDSFNPYDSCITQSATAGNISLLIKCLENGTNVNEIDNVIL